MPHDAPMPVLNHVFTELLLATLPFIRTYGGEKKKHLRRVWISAFQGVTAEALGADVGSLPQSPRAAALACVKASVQLCRALGVERVELAEFFNLLGERVELPPSSDESLDRLFAFVLAMAAQRQLEMAGRADKEEAQQA